MTAQTGRMIEATQFTIQDYEVFKSGTKFDNKFRQMGMELMAQDEKNPKSELSKIGLKEVRRVRVLRDAADSEGTTLKLVYETKSDKREIERKAYEAEQKKRQNALYTFPVWVPDAKVYLKAVFTEAIEFVDNSEHLADPLNTERNIKKELAESLEALSMKVSESRLTLQELAEVRIEIYKLVNLHTSSRGTEGMTPEEVTRITSINEERSKLFIRLDLIASALNIIPRSLFDKSSFLEHARKLDPRPPPKHHGKPQGQQQKQEPSGPSKTKLQKQNRQHRQPKGAEEKKEQPQA